MSDEEDYNSEEDVDYIPSDGELGSEEENSGDEEDLSILAADGDSLPQTAKRTRGKKSNKNNIAPRKRKGGIKLEGEKTTEGGENKEDPGSTELAEKIKEETVQKKEVHEKKRSDDLWASFLSDVPKRPTPSKTSNLAIMPSPRATDTSKTTDTAKATDVKTTKPNSEKITITKVFDFAGEEIRVTKEVDVNSKEAQAELKKQQQSEQSAASVSTTTPSTSSPAPSTTQSPASGISATIGLKRPAPTGGGVGGLSGLLGKIGKKQKMGTLEKSKIDWESFKHKEGINEDLKIHNKGKDGYIERMAFLNRTDHRQYEIERDLRLNKTGKR